MAFLEQFSPEERDLIVSIPYRAGVWISSVDDTGGAKANQEELGRLEIIITEKARGMFESAFVHEVMAEIFQRKAEWQGWAARLDDCLEDCQKAVALTVQKLEERDIDAYRANIMGIGLEVAKAFREFESDASFWVKINTKIRLLLEAAARIIKRDRSYDSVSALNISYEEDKALAKLSQALHPGLDGAR